MAKTKSQVCSKYQRWWYFDLGLISLLTEVWLVLMINQRDLEEVKEMWILCITTFVFVKIHTHTRTRVSHTMANKNELSENLPASFKWVVWEQYGFSGSCNSNGEREPWISTVSQNVLSAFFCLLYQTYNMKLTSPSKNPMRSEVATIICIHSSRFSDR